MKSSLRLHLHASCVSERAFQTQCGFWFPLLYLSSARKCVKAKEAERMRFIENKTIDRKNLMVNYLSVGPSLLANGVTTFPFMPS